MASEKQEMVNYLEEYCVKVLSGEIVACRKIIQLCNMLLKQLRHPEQCHGGRWQFNLELATRPITFIETFCKQPSGKIGKPLKLALFQKAMIQALFGFVEWVVDEETGKGHYVRQYNELFMICGRKNGKTSLLSALLLYMLLADNEGAPQCLTAAVKLDQSKLSFEAAHNMVKQSPDLKRLVQKRAYDLYNPLNMGYIRALSGESSSLDGLNIHCCICDELAAWKSRAVYDLVKQATSSREQPIIMTITTNGFIRDSIYDSNYDYAEGILNGDIDDPKFLPFIYELDDYEEFDQPDMYIKANPGLGEIKSVEYLLDIVKRARADVTLKPTVYVKEFDLKQTGATSWLRWEDFNNDEKVPDYPFRYGIASFDAADTTDLNAAKVIMMKPDDPHIYVKSMYWLPEKVLKEWEEQGKLQGRDNVPYRLWQAKGFLRTVNSHKVDKHVILDWFREVQEHDDVWIKYIAYDPWHVDDSLERDFKNEFGEKTMIPIRQGTATLSQPMKDLKADLQAGLIVYDGNPIDKWCFANTAIKTDINANIQPVKTDDNRKRIDGTMALLDGYVALQDKRDEYLAYI